MPFTKSKTILLVAVVLLLCLAAGIVANWQLAGNRRMNADLQGFWEGAIEVRHLKLRMVVKVEKADGRYTATMDSIDQGAKDIPISAVTLSNGTVRFELASMQAGYQGNLNRSATEIVGQWRQRGGSLPLTLRRTTNPSAIAAPLPATAYLRRQDSPLQGAWKGTIDAGAVPLRVVFRISETAPGKFAGVMDSTDQGARNIPLTTIEFTPPTARFEIASIDGHYDGTLKDDASEMDGTWTQVGKDFPLLLRRSDPTEDSPPSESSYSFASDKELQGFWHGTLDAAGTKLRLRLKIARATNGTYSATMDSLDQGSKDIPATTVTFNQSDLQVEWAVLRAMFHGKLENGKLVGFWQQGPADFPIEFERTNLTSRADAPK